MDGTLDLWLVRHGATAPNAERRYPAPGEDAPLSAEGRSQAEALRGVLPAADRVYVSPTRRARETARLAGYARPRSDPRLLEASFGVLAGKTWTELEAEYGAAPRGWLTALSDPQDGDGPPGGESGAAFHRRVGRWLSGLPERGTVLAFTHAGPVQAALQLTLSLPAAEVRPAAAVHLRRAEGIWWPVFSAPGPLRGAPPATDS